MVEASFDSNILIDTLLGVENALAEIQRVERKWISRISWIEVMAKVDADSARVVEAFLDDFLIDELNEDIARRAALLRGERSRLKLPDAIILASAQIAGRILVTRNTKDFPADMPGIRVPYTL